MAGIPGSARCPCGSKRKYRQCCQPLHQGQPAQRPSDLVRARFAAFSLGLIDYLLATTHPDGPQWRLDSGPWRAELEQFSKESGFLSLQIGLEQVDKVEAWVEYHLVLRIDGKRQSYSESSSFRWDDEAGWRFYDASLPKA